MRGSFQGFRYWRETNWLAGLELVTRSAASSQRMRSPERKATLPSRPDLVRRWPYWRLQVVAARDLMESRNSRMWPGESGMERGAE